MVSIVCLFASIADLVLSHRPCVVDKTRDGSLWTYDKLTKPVPVYFILDGYKRLVESQRTYQRIFRDWQCVKMHYMLEELCQSGMIGDDWFVAVSNATYQTRHFLVDNGARKKRWASEGAYANFCFNTAAAKEMNDTELAYFENGPPIAPVSCIPNGARCEPYADSCCQAGSTVNMRCSAYMDEFRCLCNHGGSGCTQGPDCCSERCLDGVCACGQIGKLCSLWEPKTCCAPLVCLPQNPPLPGDNGHCGVGPTGQTSIGPPDTSHMPSGLPSSTIISATSKVNATEGLVASTTKTATSSSTPTTLPTIRSTKSTAKSTTSSTTKLTTTKSTTRSTTKSTTTKSTTSTKSTVKSSTTSSTKSTVKSTSSTTKSSRNSTTSSTTSTTTTTTTSTTTTTPLPCPHLGQPDTPVEIPSTLSAAAWNPRGCFFDAYPNWIVSGTLTNGFPTYYPWYNMTLTYCLEICERGGFLFAAVQSGITCSCGNAASNLINPALNEPASSHCAALCSGNSSEHCGGYSYSALYEKKTTSTGCKWHYDACIADLYTYDRMLTGLFLSINDKLWTVERCLRLCAAHAYSYAGLEHGYECFCGNSYTRQVVASNNCTDTCVPNACETCGGPYTLSAYARRCA